MPLAIDPATPAATSGSLDPNTSGSFTPPDVAAMCLVLWAGNSNTSTDPTTPTISSSPSQTWTRNVWDHRSSGTPALDGHAAIWSAKWVLSPGPMTVSVDITTSSHENAMLPLLMTGHDTTAPIGENGGGRQLGGTVLYASYIGSITGGQGFFVVCDWGATDSSLWTPGPDCTMMEVGNIAGKISWAMMRRTSADGVSGGTTNFELNGLTSGGEYHYAYVEVISAEAGADARLSSSTDVMREPNEPSF